MRKGNLVPLFVEAFLALTDPYLSLFLQFAHDTTEDS
jgi:hypothetical protein